MVDRIRMCRDTFISESTMLEPGVRPMESDDSTAFGNLLYAAYRGGVDDAGETPSDAIVEAQELLAGKYGPVLMSSSFVKVDGIYLAAATVVVRLEENIALLAYALTAPIYRRRGLAGRLISLSIDSLARRGYIDVKLVVTRANVDAVKLYRTLGFREVDAEGR
jgi:ribosomal protein S18 acetylase RimI-like enzyme